MQKANVLITKQAAAQRQLDSAIRILFAGEDPLSVHTLTWAAYTVLADLDSKSDKIIDQRYRKISDDMQRQLLGKVAFEDTQGFKTLAQKSDRRGANFLKHADKDHIKALDPSTLKTDNLLLEACAVYQEMGFTPTQEMRAFVRWHLAVYPNVQNDRIKTKAGDVSKFSREQQLEFGDFILNNAFRT